MLRPKALVAQHLENVSGDRLEKYQRIIREIVSGRHGVYALYRRNRLYYVGLAGNLRRRLKRHLHDRHAGRWDRFSVYLTVDDGYLKEPESLVLRIVPTEGNRVRGCFAASESLNGRIQRAVRADFDQQMQDMLGKRPRLAKAERRRGRRRRITSRADGWLPLAGVFLHTITLQKRYKGKLYRARLRRDGRICYEGRLFDSPSPAAKQVTGRRTNGWRFWTYEARPQQWVPLSHLRR